MVFESGNDRRVVEEGDLADYDYSALQYGGSPELTGFKGEEAFSGAILELVESRKPKVLLTSGPRRGLARRGRRRRPLRRRATWSARRTSSSTSWASLGQADVPAGTDLLVIAGAKARFVEPELAGLRHATSIAAAGCSCCSIRSSRRPAVSSRPDSRRWLDAYGVQVGANIVVDPGATVPLYGAETLFAGASGAHPIVRSLEQAKVGVIVALARSVGAGRAPEGTAAQVLLQTTAEGWGETDLAHLRAVAKDGKDLTGPVPLAVAVGAQAKEAAPADLEDEELTPPAPKPAATAAASSGLAAGRHRRLRLRDQQPADALRQPDDARQHLQLAARPPEAPRHRSEEAGAGPHDAHSGPALGDHLAGARGAPGAGDRRRRRGLLPAPEVGRVRPRTLLILAVVVGALLALIYFAEDKVASTDERAAAAKRLVSVKADEIVALEIEWQGSRVRFERAAGSRVDSRAGKAAPPAGRHEALARRGPGGSSRRSRSAPTTPPSTAWSVSSPGSRRRATSKARRAGCRSRAAARTVIWKTATAEGRLEIGGAVPATHDVVVAASGRRALAVTADGFDRRALPPGRRVAEPRSRGGDPRPIERVTLSAGRGAGRRPGQSGESLRLESPVPTSSTATSPTACSPTSPRLRMETFLDPPLAAGGREGARRACRRLSK